MKKDQKLKSCWVYVSQKGSFPDRYFTKLPATFKEYTDLNCFTIVEEFMTGKPIMDDSGKKIPMDINSRIKLVQWH